MLVMEPLALLMFLSILTIAHYPILSRYIILFHVPSSIQYMYSLGLQAFSKFLYNENFYWEARKNENAYTFSFFSCLPIKFFIVKEFGESLETEVITCAFTHQHVTQQCHTCTHAHRKLIRLVNNTRHYFGDQLVVLTRYALVSFLI